MLYLACTLAWATTWDFRHDLFSLIRGEERTHLEEYACAPANLLVGTKMPRTGMRYPKISISSIADLIRKQRSVRSCRCSLANLVLRTSSCLPIFPVCHSFNHHSLTIIFTSNAYIVLKTHLLFQTLLPLHTRRIFHHVLDQPLRPACGSRLPGPSLGRAAFFDVRCYDVCLWCQHLRLARHLRLFVL